jgi:hypothetical protein
LSGGRETVAGKKRQAPRVGYRIVVRGEFGDLLAAAFDDMTVSTGGNQTVLTGRLRNSQELYGVLDRLRDLGVHLEHVSKAEKGS